MNSPIWGGAYDAVLRKNNFDEAEHPRVPAGGENGGQFAPKGGDNAGLGKQLMQMPFEALRGHGSFYKKFDDEFSAFKRAQQKLLAEHGATWEEYQAWLSTPAEQLPSEVWHAHARQRNSRTRGGFVLQ